VTNEDSMRAAVIPLENCSGWGILMGSSGTSVAANMLACDGDRKEGRMRRAASVEQGGNLRCLLV
jgi:hypothetical protein